MKTFPRLRILSPLAGLLIAAYITSCYFLVDQELKRYTEIARRSSLLEALTDEKHDLFVLSYFMDQSHGQGRHVGETSKVLDRARDNMVRVKSLVVEGEEKHLADGLSKCFNELHSLLDATQFRSDLATKFGRGATEFFNLLENLILYERSLAPPEPITRAAFWLATGLLVVALSTLVAADVRTVRKFRLSLNEIEENLLALLDLRPLKPVASTSQLISTLDQLVHQVAYRSFLSLREEQAPIGKARDIVCKLSKDGSIQRLNPSGQRVFGTDAGDIRGFLCRAAAEEFCSLLARESSFTCETDVQHSSILWLNWSCVWSSIDSAYFCIARDVTELRRAQEFRTQLIRMIGHDVRSPLSALRVFLSVLDSGKYGQMNEKGAQRLKSARSDVLRITGLVDELVDFERIESGGLILATIRTDVDDVIRAVIESVTPIAEQQATELTYTASHLPVNADPDRLFQILGNLVGNAIKFSKPNGEVIVSSKRSEDGNVAISVRDFGKGIAADDIDRIFEPFFQSGRSDRSGYGLGLAIVRMLVQQHEGTIAVKSQLGSGTEFIVTLPLWSEPAITGSNESLIITDESLQGEQEKTETTEKILN
jgi:signal transduction histidine kinase